MAESESRLHVFFAELKRRRVVRALIIYAAIVWVVIQVADVALPALRLPEWTITLVVVLALAGFPLISVLAWIYDLTHEGVTRTAPPGAAVPSVAPRRSRLTRAGLAALGLLVIVATAWTVWRLKPWIVPTVSATRVAVLPFTVRGSEDLAYLADGMVDLLATKLDGSGDLQSVDPFALLAFVRRSGELALDPEWGRSVAQHFGAGLFVLGSITEAGGRLQISASLYDSKGRSRSTAQADGEGEEQILRLVDDVIRRLLAERYQEPEARLTRLATLTTGSIEALKAYLSGERALRQGEFASALEAFQRATQEDTTFALAYFRLAVAAGWSDRHDLKPKVAAQAARFAARLSDHDRRFLEAYEAYIQGDAPRAEAIYRAVLFTHPDDVEAWQQLGETLYHHNTYYGRSMLGAREAFERALSLGRDRLEPLHHLAHLAAYEGNRAEFDALRARIRNLGAADSPSLWVLDYVEIFRFGSPERRDRLISELRKPYPGSYVGLLSALSFARDVEGAERVSRLMTDPAHPPNSRSIGHEFVADIEATRGRWSAVMAELARAESLAEDRMYPVVDRARLAIGPHLAVPVEDLDRIRSEIEVWDSTGSAPYVPGRAPQPLFRHYILGHLSVRREDDESARRAIARLESMGDDPERGELAKSLAHSVRAHLAWTRGEHAEALASLEEGTMVIDADLRHTSPFYNRAFERFLRAEILLELGRDPEARGWYEGIVETGMWEALFLAPAHRRLGEIYTRLGERARAADHYKRFVEIWADPDPELRPIVEHARTRLAELSGEQAAGL